MKINNNPLKLNKRSGNALILAGISELSDALLTVQAGALKQIKVLTGLEQNSVREKRTQEIEQMLGELDRALEKCTHNGKNLTDGTFARGSVTGSLWIHLGAGQHQHERIFIPTMGFLSRFPGKSPKAALKELAQNLKEMSPQQFESFRRDFRNFYNKVFFNINAYRIRINLAAAYVHLTSEVLDDKTDLRNTPHHSQLSFLQFVRGSLTHLERIVKRLRKSARRARGLDRHWRQYMQVEVSQLIDCVDRIASQAEFNRMNLFLGGFASSSRMTSIWFVGPGKSDYKRMYVPTMTGRSLGLRNMDNTILTISASTSQAAYALNVLERALDRLRNERGKIETYIKDFEDQDTIKPQIRLRRQNL